MRTHARLLLALGIAALLAPPTGVAHDHAAIDPFPMCAVSTYDMTGGCLTGIRFTWSHPTCAVAEGSYDCAIPFTASGVILGEACVRFTASVPEDADALVRSPLACSDAAASAPATVHAPATEVRVQGVLLFRNLPHEGADVEWGSAVCLHPATSRTSAAPQPHPITCRISAAGGHETIPPA